MKIEIEENKKQQSKKLENKLKFDWHELIPIIGLIKCIPVNFDYAEKRNYVGLGGQLAKHIEQCKNHGLVNSIPANIILYGLYQVIITSEIIYELFIKR